MKKAIFALAASATLATFAAAVKTTWVDFGTKGPDTYADGTAVAPGAEYRLLYLPAGVTSLADATVCRTATAVALATGGAHCPLTTFQYPIDSKDYVGGSFVTVLADGTVGAVTVVASKTATGACSGQTLAAAGTAPVAGSPDSVAATGKQPRIEAVAVKSGRVELTVSGLCVGTYSVETGTPGGEWTATGYGFASCVKDAPSVTVVVPVDAGAAAGFYRVMAR